jgi:hypothetical protein
MAAGMSDQEKRTREARLIASPPEAVYRELKIYSEKVIFSAVMKKWKEIFSPVKIS